MICTDVSFALRHLTEDGKLRVGDILTAVDGRPLVGMSVTEIIVSHMLPVSLEVLYGRGGRS